MIDLKEFRELSMELTVLYVEDELKIRENLKTYLDKFFSKVDVAVDGEDGLNHYKKNSYDIVITDISMPKMEGIEMGKRIKEINPEQDIIIVSAYSDISYFIQTIKIGIDGYILKPIDFTQILEVLHKTIKRIITKKRLMEHQLYLEKTVEQKN
jgi:YesN/AraC family two-component response regulator